MIAAYTSGPIVWTTISKIGLEGDALVAAGLALRDEVRRLYAVDYRNNSIHVSDSTAEAEREKLIWFE